MELNKVKTFTNVSCLLVSSLKVEITFSLLFTTLSLHFAMIIHIVPNQPVCAISTADEADPGGLRLRLLTPFRS